MDLKLIKNLVRIMERGDVNELEIDDEKAGLRVHLRRGPERQAMGAAPVVQVLPGSSAAPQPAAQDAPAGQAETTQEASRGTQGIVSPMVGTFYRQPSPNDEVFVSVGSFIDEDSVVCIIEAMKVMNEIKAECSGEIVEVLIENGEPVEHGQPLFLVKTD